jgi:NAD(P)-dependent dehydrogenase (short-subunit alcohol dehydrogenase family)
MDVYKGRWALITGGGDGIGRMLAHLFAEHGTNVVVADIRENAAMTVAEECRGFGVEARALVFDTGDRDAVTAAASTLGDVGVRSLAVLWLNAGVGAAASLLDGKPSAIEWVISVNVFGPIWAAQAFVPLIDCALGPAHVGITASTASVVPVSGPLTLYAASKQGTLAVGEALRVELAPRGIGVTMLCPGLLNTNIWNAARARPERFGGVRQAPVEAGARWRAALSPGILREPVLRTMAAGGGYCIVPTEDGTQARFEARSESIHQAFRASISARPTY